MEAKKFFIKSQWELTAWQFVNFTGVGALGTICHYLVLIFLVNVVRTKAVTGSVCGSILGAVVNYLLNYQWTFRSKKKHLEALSKFFIIAIIGLLVNASIMFVGTEIFLFHYLLLQVLATGIVLLWNFAGNKWWTFKIT